MKFALIVCMALFAVALVQAEDETRITNGRPAVPRQFPFMAYVETDDRKCMGSLITRVMVLTSAYCTEGYTHFTVRLGSIYRTQYDTHAWSVNSSWAVTHPKFDYAKHHNEIGIVYLPKKAPLNEFIQPVHLPSPDAGSFIGCDGIVSGWGYTSPTSGHVDHLLWAKVIVIPNEICKMFINDTTITSSFVCAGAENSTAFWGDNGAPLVIQTKMHYLQIGLFVHIPKDYVNTSKPALYTRVSSFIDWIKQTRGHQ